MTFLRIGVSLVGVSNPSTKRDDKRLIRNLVLSVFGSRPIGVIESGARTSLMPADFDGNGFSNSQKLWLFSDPIE